MNRTAGYAVKTVLARGVRPIGEYRWFRIGVGNTNKPETMVPSATIVVPAARCNPSIQTQALFIPLRIFPDFHDRCLLLAMLDGHARRGEFPIRCGDHVSRLQRSGELGSKKLPGNEQDEMIEDGALHRQPIARRAKPPVRERRSPPKQSAIVASRPIPQSLNRRNKSTLLNELHSVNITQRLACRQEIISYIVHDITYVNYMKL